MHKKNPFQVFNIDVSFNVDKKHIENTYIVLQKKYHPDLQSGNIEKSLEITKSYHILIDNIKRGDEILNIFSVDINSIVIDTNFYEEIININENSQTNSNELLIKYLNKINSFTQITKNNINDFSINYIKYKYILRTVEK